MIQDVEVRSRSHARATRPANARLIAATRTGATTRPAQVAGSAGPPFTPVKLGTQPTWVRAARRSADVFLAALALILLAPLMFGIGLGVRLTSPGPAIFKQQRVGRGRELFTCYKFRTMAVNCDDSALRDVVQRQLRGEDTSSHGSFKIHSDPRVTKFGALLRRTSLDELPQLFNVILGGMSMVGPRPMLKWEADSLSAQFQSRFETRPGITGLWQVSGRSTVSTLEMLRLDLCYVRRQTLRSYFLILLRTIPVVLRGDGAR